MRCRPHLICLLLIVSLTGCAARGRKTTPVNPPRRDRHEFVRQAFGRDVRITLYADSKALAAEAAAAAFERLAELEAKLTAADPNGDLAKLRAAAGGPWQRTGDDVFVLLQQCTRLAERTGGAFDATAGPLAALWATSFAAGTLPPPEALLDARARTGWRKVQIESIDRRVRLLLPGVRVDFGELALGYAVDAALDELRRRGTPRALIEAGSIVCAGSAPPPPATAGWVVVVPDARQKSGRRTMTLRNRALAHAGDGQHDLMVNGTRYTDRVDPRTGLGLTHRTAVTAMARRAFGAAQIASAAVALPPDERAAFIADARGARIVFRSPTPPPRAKRAR